MSENDQSAAPDSSGENGSTFLGDPSGEPRFRAGRDLNVAGDVVLRDKVVNNIRNIYQHALTAAEQIEHDESIEAGRLARGVMALLQRLKAIAEGTGDTASGSPYQRLEAYHLSDAELFFGRRQAILDLLPMLERARLLVLHGESGAGKSSLFQAGIAPYLLAQGHLPISVRPYDRLPSIAIKWEFVSGLSLTPLLESAPLREFLRQACRALDADSRLYICLDQFEEFWAQSGPSRLEEPERNRFIRELGECLDDEGLGVHWILLLRSEAFGNLSSFRPYIANPFEAEYRLKRFTRAEALLAITEPARRHHVGFEPGLLEEIVDDLGGQTVAPSQMQLVCDALYRELRADERVITAAHYERRGGAAGILSNYLEQVLSRELAISQREAARRLIESLITSEAQRVKRTHADLVAELSARGIAPQTLDVLLGQLVQSRLVTREEAGPGRAELQYELTHDYLLKEIELDPATQRRKAAQELLEQETRAYRRHRTQLTLDRLAVIWPLRRELVFTPEAKRLFTASQVSYLGWLIAIGLALLALSVWLWGYPEYLRQQVLRASPLVAMHGGETDFGALDPIVEAGELPARILTVEAFQIEATEVTARLYTQCIQARVCEATPDQRDYLETLDSLEKPMVQISAVHAQRYCKWLGRRLPTEIEWERAARGLRPSRLWPWGEEPPTHERTNVITPDFIDPTGTMPVGSFPAGATSPPDEQGVMDLIGNVWEWTTSTHANCPNGADTCPWNENDEVALVVRGGAWDTQVARITLLSTGLSRNSADRATGFRCVAAGQP
jgi:formylglycine-generating enzyme required for sulfatase activity